MQTASSLRHVRRSEMDFVDICIDAPVVAALGDEVAAAAATCSRCGHMGLTASTMSTAFWRDGGLLVIEDIPSLTCPACREQYVADETALAIDRMRGSGFDPAAAVGRLNVPVFRFAAMPSS